MGVSDGEDTVIWEQVIAWVNCNKGRIINKAKIFTIYSPYYLEDYLQQAYIAAYIAIKACIKKREIDKFERYFWITYKSQCCKAATNPSIKDVIEGENISKSPCIYKDINEVEISINTDPLTELLEEESNSSLIETDAYIHEVLSLMTAKERQVWENILGFNKGVQTSREMASIFSTTKERIKEIKKEGIERVKRNVYTRFESGFDYRQAGL